MNEQDNQCVLIFDEMSLKSGLTYNAQTDSIEGFEDFGDLGPTKYVANHALAFMVRVLATKWKQPVGYFLTSGTVTVVVLQTLLSNCISKLTNVGLRVKVVVCDQGSNNRSRPMLNALNVTATSPFFFKDGKEINVVYDPPHLIKNIRNNFRKHGFLWDGEH